MIDQLYPGISEVYLGIKKYQRMLLMMIFGFIAAIGLLNDNIHVFVNESNFQDAAVELLQSMTLEEKIGQMFMIDYRKDQNRGGVTAINENMVTVLQNFAPGGIILFEENTVDVLQTKGLVEQFQNNSPKIPLFIAIDQEGGAVTRLPYATIMPGNMALGAVNNRRLAYRIAKATGKELAVLGINMNFAPVVDINNNPNNPVIGVRSFGDSPDMVSELGLYYMKGLHNAGIISVAKHFPGHGDTTVDSHIDLPLVPHDMERLETVELKPYYTLIKNKVEMIMTAHVIFPTVEAREGLPATLSYQCLTGLLRKKMGFDGVIITDALNMQAITKKFGDSQAAEMAILAGADMLLMPRDLKKTWTHILNLVTSGKIPVERLDASVKRILTLKLKKGIIGPKKQSGAKNIFQTLANKSNSLLKKEVAEQAVTLVKNIDQQLPFKPDGDQRIVFFAPSQKGLEAIQRALNNLLRDLGIEQAPVAGFNYAGLNSLNTKHRKAIDECDYVILFTRTAKAEDLKPKRSYVASFASVLTAYVDLSDKRIVAIAIRNPYDIQFMPEVKAYIAAYTDWNGGGVEAALKTVFGMINPAGRLPVDLPDQDGTILYRRGFGLTYTPNPHL